MTIDLSTNPEGPKPAMSAVAEARARLEDAVKRANRFQRLDLLADTADLSLILALPDREALAQAVAAVAVQTDDSSTEDREVARLALDIVPPSEHPDAIDILAEIARDARRILSHLKGESSND